jgi:hypothetical protein
VNFSFFPCLATCRMRSSPCDTVVRFRARSVLCWPTFPSAPALGSIFPRGRGAPAGISFPNASRNARSIPLQNWKRMPTVGSIEYLCRKPFARPFDTCDHMMPA